MIAYASTLPKALGLAIEVEGLAEQYVLARALGGPVNLDDGEMDVILAKFKTYGKQPAELAEMDAFSREHAVVPPDRREGVPDRLVDVALVLVELPEAHGRAARVASAASGGRACARAAVGRGGGRVCGGRVCGGPAGTVPSSSSVMMKSGTCFSQPFSSRRLMRPSENILPPRMPE